MEIRLKNKRFEKILQDENLLMAYCATQGASAPSKAADEIYKAISHLEAAPSMHEIPPYFRPHMLYRDRSGQYGMDITDRHRLILRPDHDENPNFNPENERSITKVIILYLCKDYHLRKDRR